MIQKVLRLALVSLFIFTGIPVAYALPVQNGAVEARGETIDATGVAGAMPDTDETEAISGVQDEAQASEHDEETTFWAAEGAAQEEVRVTQLLPTDVQLAQTGSGVSVTGTTIFEGGVEYKANEILVSFTSAQARLEGITLLGERLQSLMTASGNAEVRALAAGSNPNALTYETGVLDAALGIQSTSVLVIPEGVSVREAVAEAQLMPQIQSAQPVYVYRPAGTVYTGDAEGTALQEGVSTQAGAGATRAAEPAAQSLAVTESEAQGSTEAYWWLQQVGAHDAWQQQTLNSADGARITVALIDTGVNLSHPNLQAQLDKVNAWNAAVVPQRTLATSDGYWGDLDGHGTLTAGVVSALASNGSEAVNSGNNKLSILPINAFYRDSAGDLVSDSTVLVSAISKAVSYRNGTLPNLRVLNMSLSGYADDATLHAAVKSADSAGILCVAAAGNNATSQPSYPSDYPEVVSVIATDQSDQYASFSDYNQFKDMSAPGVGMATTSLDGTMTTTDGTSMASALVAAAAGLLFSISPGLSSNQVKNTLYSSALDLGSAGWDERYGYGRLDLSQAVRLLAPAPNTGAPIASGTYIIRPKSSFLRVWDVENASKDNCARILQFSYHGGPNQQFVIAQDSNGYYTFTQLGTSKVLDVYGASTDPGASLIQFSATGGLNQKWYLTQNSDGTYVIHSALGLYDTAPDLVCDVSGGSDINGVQLATFWYHGGDNQCFEIIPASQGFSLLDTRVQLPSTNYYRIEPVYATGTLAWDIYGGLPTQGAMLDVYSKQTPAALNQLFYFTKDADGYYLIHSAVSTYVLDVYGAVGYSGAQVCQFRETGGDNQKWALRAPSNYDGNTDSLTVTVLTKLNAMCLDVPNASFARGTVISLFPYYGGTNQQFKLTKVDLSTARPPAALAANQPYMIASASDDATVFDVNNASNAAGVTVSSFWKHGGSNQIFFVEPVAAAQNTYAIKNYKSGLYLSETAGVVTQEQGRNGGNPDTTQQWRYAAGGGGYKLYNVASGLAVTRSSQIAYTTLALTNERPLLEQAFVFAETVLPLANGLDVSSWQPADIGWRVDYDFLIVKATGGIDFRNSYLEPQAGAALARNRRLGLYHFANDGWDNADAITEADYFVDTIQPYLGRALLFLDYERDVGQPGLQDDVAWITQFCNRVKERTGIACNIYCSGSPATYQIYGLWNNLGAWLWEASYAYSKDYYDYEPNDYYWITPDEGMRIHQYSSKGRLAGYNGYLDMNIFYGTLRDWNYQQSAH